MATVARIGRTPVQASQSAARAVFPSIFRENLIFHDHESCGALGKALAEVGAGSLLADRVQVIFAQARLEFTDPVTGRRLGSNPGRLALHGFGRHHLDRYARHLVGALEFDALHYLVFFQLSVRVMIDDSWWPTC